MSRVENNGSTGHGRSKNQQIISGQCFSDAPKCKDDRVSTPRSQGKCNESLRPICSMYG